MDWPHQTYAFEEIDRQIAGGCRSMCVTTPTGGGKSRIAIRRLEKAISEGRTAILYTNRIMLTQQMIRVLSSHGIPFGVRAAGFSDYQNLSAPIQIASIQTENSRSIKTMKTFLHRADEVIVDEAHLQKGGTAGAIIEKHKEAGSVIIGFTATPVGIADIYDKLIVAGKTSELRACGALVAAEVFAPTEFDIADLKPKVTTGEYGDGELKKYIQTPQVFANVFQHWQKLNPDARPTLLFASGVPESIWWAHEFEKKGVKSASIDGESIYCDGQTYQSKTDGARDDILARFKAGDIKLLCNRFVLREGIDIPEAYHGILATPIGSVTSYIQIVGRLLRFHATTPKVLITDHGGNWHRHGSPNADRDWESAWGVSAYNIGKRREEALKKKVENEGIVCAACGAVRAKGPSCYKCGHMQDRKMRMVIQKNGQLKQMTGDIYREPRRERKSNTEQLWNKTFWSMRNSGKTFRQAEAWFFRQHHYYPPRDLPYMPQNSVDWERKIKSVPMGSLIQGVKE